MADSLDGLLARFQNKSSKFGAFLDSCLDRVSDFFYLIGFWVLFRPLHQDALSTILVMIAFLLTVLISYVKARAEALGIECRVGVMERGARVIYLIAWALLSVALDCLPWVLWGGVILYIGLTAWTAAHRVIHIRNRMIHDDDPGG
jgi:CDP-diacylglycerol--glycerol-3-phosphate 3-phosphatidyltransferase